MLQHIDWAMLADFGATAAQHPATALLAPVGAYLFRGYQGRKLARDHIADRLIAIQRDLATLAFGTGGGAKQRDHVNELVSIQFRQRVQDLREHAATRSLGAKLTVMLDQYSRAIEDYIASWVLASNQSSGLTAQYNTTRRDLHRALRALSRYSVMKREIIELEDRTRADDPDKVQADNGNASRQRNGLRYQDQPVAEISSDTPVRV